MARPRGRARRSARGGDDRQTPDARPRRDAQRALDRRVGGVEGVVAERAAANRRPGWPRARAPRPGAIAGPRGGRPGTAAAGAPGRRTPGSSRPGRARGPSSAGDLPVDRGVSPGGEIASRTVTRPRAATIAPTGLRGRPRAIASPAASAGAATTPHGEPTGPNRRDRGRARAGRARPRARPRRAPRRSRPRRGASARRDHPTPGRSRDPCWHGKPARRWRAGPAGRRVRRAPAGGRPPGRASRRPPRGARAGRSRGT